MPRARPAWFGRQATTLWLLIGIAVAIALGGCADIDGDDLRAGGVGGASSVGFAAAVFAVVLMARAYRRRRAEPASDIGLLPLTHDLAEEEFELEPGRRVVWLSCWTCGCAGWEVYGPREPVFWFFAQAQQSALSKVDHKPGVGHALPRVEAEVRLPS